MDAELVVNQTKKIVMSSFEKQLDLSGQCALDIKSGRFSYFTPEFYFEDFEKFVCDLETIYKTLEGSAELKFHYESESIKFVATSQGHIEFFGEFIEYGNIQQTLSCGFELDQTYLDSFITQLKKVVLSVYS